MIKLAPARPLISRNFLYTTVALLVGLYTGINLSGLNHATTANNNDQEIEALVQEKSRLSSALQRTQK